MIGTYYLQANSFNIITLLPATACGLLSVAVLNINNMRDIENDIKAGKNTLAVRLGTAGCTHLPRNYYYRCHFMFSVFQPDLLTRLEWLAILTCGASIDEPFTPCS